MRTRGTGPGSAKKSPATRKAAGSKTNNAPHKSPSQTPNKQEDLDVAASPGADFHSLASNAKIQDQVLAPDDAAALKSAVFNGVADQSGIIKQEQSALTIQAVQAAAGAQMTQSIVDNNLGEKQASKVTAGKAAASNASSEKSNANASGQGEERSINGASSASECVAEASVKSMDTAAEENDKKELSEKEGKEEEDEEEEEEVEELEEIEVEEEIEDEGAEEEVDDEVEMEDQEGEEEEEVVEEEEEEVVEEEELADGEDEEGEQEGQGDEEAELEDAEEEIEVIEEIEYEDEEDVEYEEEEIEVEEEEQDGDGEEEMADVQEEAEQFAKEYPDVQQVMPVSERQKRKKMEVFVGGLDRDATEEDLKKVFERVGEVKEVRLMKSFHTGKNKGFAFVQYATAAQAQRAAIELERVQVRGRMCGVVPSEENDILFIGNLNKIWNKETVMETLKKYGLENIEELTLMEDPQHAGMNRGFAFVEFSTHKDARIGFRRLQRPNVVFGTDRPAKVAWADPVNEPDDEVMAQVKSVFVDGMPTTWDEEKAKEHFGQYGEIERIVLARNMPFAKRKDFGFVNYAARESAVACVEGVNNMELADGGSKVKVKVKLSKPQLRTIKTVASGLRGGYHMDWNRGRWGFHGGRFFPGRGRGAKPGWGHGYESGWGRGFEPGWLRGSGRFSFGRGRGRFGRGFSRGASFSGRYQFRNEASTAQPLLHVLKEQTGQEDSMADRAMMNHKDKKDPVTAKDRKTAKVINVEGGKPLGEKFECTMCGFASDVESEFNTHQMSRVHKIIEGMRKEEKLTNKTPLSLLHEYASRHRCEVHYDIASENALGPFEVYATIGGANTGIPSTRGVGKGHNKAKARQMAAADALEKIMVRIPDLEFGRPVQGRQHLYERPVAEINSRNFSNSRARGPPNRSGMDFHKSYYEGNRPFSGGYGTSPRRGNSARLPGRLRSGHLARDEHPRTRNLGLAGDYEERAARSYSRGAIRSRYDDGGEFLESFGGGRGRGSSRGGNVLAAHREAYFQHLEQSQGQGYGSNRASAAIREYGEAVPGVKRTISALDVDPRIDNIPHRGHPRARVERVDLVSVAPGGSEYASGSLYAASPSAFQEDSYSDAQQFGLYDSHQSALDMAGAGIYPSSSHSYGSLYGGASDIHGSTELLAGSRYPSSALHGYSQGPSLGGSYSAVGPGTGSYY